ncbi:MAG: nodulation protein NodH [Roseobacter sp.]
MKRPFKSFVVFADMRTGSNLLEANLNALDGVQCIGEVFNATFVGYPNRSSLYDISMAERDADPHKLLKTLVHHDQDLVGFRYFHDHDPRILDTVLGDENCAKIVLTRPPIESYVSLKIAQQTGQWKLTQIAKRKSAKVLFDPTEYRSFADTLSAYYAHIRRALQVTGQAGFFIDYRDLTELEVINGLAKFLGAPSRLEKTDQKLKVQNPESLTAKVENPQDMQRALAADHEETLSRLPEHEPSRLAAVPTYIATASAPVLFLPINGGPTDVISQWMAELDGEGPAALHRGMSQKQLRQWKRSHKGHRSFTVLRHPALRAYRVFRKYILPEDGPQAYARARRVLQGSLGVALPQDPTDIPLKRAAFKKFLDFLHANLSGQTNIRVDGAWCTQGQALQGFGTLVPPDFVFRETDLTRDLAFLADCVGCGPSCGPIPATGDADDDFDEIYDDEIEKKAATAYRRDYALFGFCAWK